MTKYTSPKATSTKKAPGAPLKAINNLGVRSLSNGIRRKLSFSTTPKKRPQPTIPSLDKKRLQARKIAKAEAKAKRSLKYQ